MSLQFTRGVNKAVILGLVDELLQNKEVCSALLCLPQRGLRRLCLPPAHLASALLLMLALATVVACWCRCP